MPPVTFREHFVQAGEPYSHQKDPEVFYTDLQLKYPNNKLLKELSRLINLLDKTGGNNQEYDCNYNSQYNLVDKVFMNKYIDSNLIKDIEDEEEEEIGIHKMICVEL